jgi:hypothetical protein
MTKKKDKLDEFHYHEALDRAYMCADIIENALMVHPVIKKHKKIKKRIEKAQQLILEAYQIIGGLEITIFPKPSDGTQNQ